MKREPLSGLDEVPWQELSHAYGPADDVPELLRRRGAARTPQAIGAVMDELYGNLFHQHSVYPATARAVPFLVALACAESTADRPGLVVYLHALATVGEPEVQRALDARMPELAALVGADEGFDVVLPALFSQLPAGRVLLAEDFPGRLDALQGVALASHLIALLRATGAKPHLSSFRRASAEAEPIVHLAGALGLLQAGEPTERALAIFRDALAGAANGYRVTHRAWCWNAGVTEELLAESFRSLPPVSHEALMPGLLGLTEAPDRMMAQYIAEELLLPLVFEAGAVPHPEAMSAVQRQVAWAYGRGSVTCGHGVTQELLEAFGLRTTAGLSTAVERLSPPDS